MRAKKSHGYSAFHLACRSGHLDMVELPMRRSAQLSTKLNANEKFGQTSFRLACMMGAQG